MKKRGITLLLLALICLTAISTPTQAKGMSMRQRCENAKSKTGWCIVVNKNTHILAVYKKYGKKWKLYVSCPCTIGKNRSGKSITRSGTFSVGKKYYVKDFGKSSAFYCTSMGAGSSGYIHTVTYAKGSRNIAESRILDGDLGQNKSNGCVRLSRWNAYFVYHYIPKGTKIVIF